MGSYNPYPLVQITELKLLNNTYPWAASITAEWWPLAVRCVQKKFGVTLLTVKINESSASKVSANTHVGGFCIDVSIWNVPEHLRDDVSLFLREMGGVCFTRTRAQGFDPHYHIALNVAGYWHNASYQVEAAKNGRNGLVSNAADTDPRPAKWATAQEGIALMKAYLNEEDELSAKDVAELKAHIDKKVYDLAGQLAGRAHLEKIGETAARHTLVANKVDRDGKKVAVIQELADAKSNSIRLLAEVAGLKAALETLQPGGGVDMDAISRAVQAAVEDALQGATVTVDLGGAA